MSAGGAEGGRSGAASGMPDRLAIGMRLRGQGLVPSGWSNGPGDRYAPHEHDYDKVIAVVRGSIVFGLDGDGGSIGLDAGDRLELPAGTRHGALVGPDGVECLEAHLAAGTLGAEPRRRRAGEW